MTTAHFLFLVELGSDKEGSRLLNCVFFFSLSRSFVFFNGFEWISREKA